MGQRVGTSIYVIDSTVYDLEPALQYIFGSWHNKSNYLFLFLLADCRLSPEVQVILFIRFVAEGGYFYVNSVHLQTNTGRRNFSNEVEIE
jgi:hypothetical protein